MKLHSRAAIGLLAVVIAEPSYATAWCTGTVSNALTYGNGDVMINSSWRSDWTTLCNLTQTRNGISPQTCFAWFSVINNSMSYNKQVTVLYYDIAAEACATIPVYGSAPTPGYVLMAR